MGFTVPRSDVKSASNLPCPSRLINSKTTSSMGFDTSANTTTKAFFSLSFIYSLFTRLILRPSWAAKLSWPISTSGAAAAALAAARPSAPNAKHHARSKMWCGISAIPIHVQKGPSTVHLNSPPSTRSRASVCKAGRGPRSDARLRACM
eukprot:6047944-Pyramimonas_sp.AAC.2